jgi:C-5 ketoreductase
VQQRGDRRGFEGADEAEFDWIFGVNVRAPYFIVRRSLPLLRDGGRIVAVSSLVTRTAPP